VAARVVLRLLIALPLCVLSLLLPACSEDAAEQAVDKAKDKAKDKARELGEQAADKGKQLAGDLGDKAKGKAGELWAERPTTGELSDSAKGIFAKGAAASDDGGVESMLAKGQQLAPVAFDVAKTLHSAIDSDIEIEPIVQKLDDEQSVVELDARIKDMPRVETINGLDVGFKDVSQWDTRGRETQSAYLILWRRENQLLGLVYRSRKRVHVDKLVAEAPRLIGLVTGAL
jgi:hypothetical protein